jgi:hypothetical protein
MSGPDMSEDVMIRFEPVRVRQSGHGIAFAALLASAALGLAGASPATAAPAGETAFASPDAAAEALGAAWRGGRTSDLLKIFGPAGEALVVSGDPVAEKNAREQFAASYAQQHRIEHQGAREAVLIIGAEDWPFPIPIVRQGSLWRFDAKAGAAQILDRRIGRDELNAIAVARAYVDAQRDYAARAPGLHEYAQQVASSDGKQDGLYWPAAAGGAESPLGPLVAAAEAKGYPPPPPTTGARAPFQGYYFRILKGQGGHAPGGAKSYVVNGHMTGGFALVAFPAKWGDSGVMTFVVNQDGIVFEKNLGPRTDDLARAVTLYDPDRSWKIALPKGP